MLQQARAAGQKPEMGKTAGDVRAVLIGDIVHRSGDPVLPADSRELRACLTDLRLGKRQAPVPALLLHERRDIRFRHGVEGVISHGAVLQADPIDIQHAVLHRAAVDRQGGAEHGKGYAEQLHQGVRHRADVSLFGGIEGGAVFKIQMLGPPVDQPSCGRKHLADRLGSRNRPAFESDHHRLEAVVDLHAVQILTVDIYGPQPAVFDKGRGVTGAGEIVRDASETDHKSHPFSDVLTVISSA